MRVIQLTNRFAFLSHCVFLGTRFLFSLIKWMMDAITLSGSSWFDSPLLLFSSLTSLSGSFALSFRFLLLPLYTLFAAVCSRHEDARQSIVCMFVFPSLSLPFPSSSSYFNTINCIWIRQTVRFPSLPLHSLACEWVKWTREEVAWEEVEAKLK